MDFEITTCRPEDYDELMVFLETSYRHSRGYFPRRYPHVWRRETVDYENRLVIKVDDRIVSHVGVFPLKMRIGKVEVMMGGIGGVATLQEFRGRGFMTKLMNYAISKMRKEGYPLSILWGDRQRYGHFGYEMAGKYALFKVSVRSLEIEWRPSMVGIVRYRGESDLLDSIISLHDKEPIVIERSRRDYELLFDMPGLMVFLSEEKSAYIAFISEHRPNRIIEYGGPPENLFPLIYSILMTLGKEYGASEVEVSCPYYIYDTFLALRRVCYLWRLVPVGMVKILSLKDTLKAYSPLLSERGSRLQIDISIGIKETGERVRLMVDRGEVLLEEIDTEPKLLLDERSMVRLLFDGPETIGLGASQLQVLFPLPLYVWGLDHI
ncbi:MAG: hypothetical protein DRJ49_04175 [Thermoprotei archaeon]|nr:MAG: hypothetical protein DRJ49_04175 [Thermoprotei archaeon]